MTSSNTNHGASAVCAVAYVMINYDPMLIMGQLQYAL